MLTEFRQTPPHRRSTIIISRMTFFGERIANVKYREVNAKQAWADVKGLQF